MSAIARLTLVATFFAATFATAEPPVENRRDAHGDPLPKGAVARLGTERLRSEDTIIFAVLSPDRKLLATTSPHTLTVWDMNTGHPCRVGAPPQPWIVRVGHPDWVSRIAFTPDGKTLAVGMLDYGKSNHTIRLYEIGTGKLVRTISGLTRHADRLEFSRDGRFLFAVLHDDRFAIWDIANATQMNLDEFPTVVTDLAFAANGQHVALAVGEYGKTKSIQVHEVAGGKLVKRLDREDAAAWSLTYSPDGRSLCWLQPSPTPAPAAARYTEVQVWDVESGKLRQRSGPINFRGDPALKNMSGARGFYFSPAGKRIAIANGLGQFPDESAVIVVDAGTFAETGRFHEPTARQHLYGLSFLDNDTLFTWGNHHSFSFWNLKTGQESRLAGEVIMPVTALAFGPDGRSLVVAARGTNSACRVCDWKTGQSVERVVGPAPRYSNPVLASNGSTLITPSVDGKVLRITDPLTGKEIASWPAPPVFHSLAISRDGRTLAGVNNDGMIMVCDARTGEERLRQKVENSSGVTSAIFSPDGLRLYVGSWEGIQMFDVTNRRRMTVLGGPPPKPKQAAVPDRMAMPHRPIDFENERREAEQRRKQWNEKGYNVSADYVAITADGKRLLSSQSEIVRVWDVEAGWQCAIVRFPKTLGASSVRHPLAVAPDGTWVAVGEGRGERGGLIGIWDPHTGQRIHRFEGHLGAANALAVSADGRLLASGGSDTTTLLWDLSGIQPPKPIVTIGEDELKRSWLALAGSDPVAAYRSVGQLSASPRAAVPFIRRQLENDRALEPLWIADRVAELDSTKFATREAASRDLATLGWTAEPALRNALASDRASAEFRRRAQALLDALPEEKHDRIGVIASRVTEVLERIGNPDARALLADLATGPPAARLTTDSRATLARLLIFR